MKIVLQPEGSGLCGQACVAMAASVSLKRAIKAVGHSRGTDTKDLVFALSKLGVPCSGRLVRISRKRPNIPPRAIIHINVTNEQRDDSHWMLNWDGKIIDPGARWPEGYGKWRIVSYLEILSPEETVC